MPLPIGTFVLPTLANTAAIDFPSSFCQSLANAGPGPPLPPQPTTASNEATAMQEVALGSSAPF
jgi:hypothetical protein